MLTTSNKEGVYRVRNEEFAIDKEPKKECRNSDTTRHRRKRRLQLPLRPLLGLFALGIAAGTMIASLIVLITSNGDDVSSWPVQPNVYLAVASAIGAACIRFAKARAAPISWWRKAMQGSTVRDLENEWEAAQGSVDATRRFTMTYLANSAIGYAFSITSTTDANRTQILSAVTKIHRTPRTSMATLMALVMIIDGALLQRATSVRSTVLEKEVELSLLLTPELPHGFSGVEVANHMSINDDANRAFSDFTDDAPMFTNFTGCKDGSTCTGVVSAPGVKSTNCESNTWLITPWMLHHGNSTWGQFHEVANNSNTFNSDTLTGMGAALSIENPIFNIDLFVMASDQASPLPEGTGVLTGIANWKNYNGSYVLRSCVLHPAIFDYAVQFQAGKIIPPSNITDARFVAWANNTRRFSTNTTSSGDTHMTTMDAFSTFLQSMITANATAGFSTPAPPGEVWSPDSSTFNQYVDQFMDLEAGSDDLSLRDPLPDIIGKMNNLMFRGALLAGRKWTNASSLMDAGLSVNQTVLGIQRTNANVFHTAFEWFAAAAILDALAILVVLPLFWGCWQFSSRLTESPFEMALAFNSPLLADVDSGSGFRAVVAKHGDDCIKYGLIDHNQSFEQASDRLTSRHVGFAWTAEPQ